MEQKMSDKQMHRKEEMYKWWVEDYKIPANLAFIFLNKFPSGYSCQHPIHKGLRLRPANDSCNLSA